MRKRGKDESEESYKLAIFKTQNHNLENISKKLTVLLWFIGIPFFCTVIWVLYVVLEEL